MPRETCQHFRSAGRGFKTGSPEYEDVVLNSLNLNSCCNNRNENVTEARCLN
jgi:hypothetical protein